MPGIMALRKRAAEDKVYKLSAIKAKSSLILIYNKKLF